MHEKHGKAEPAVGAPSRGAGGGVGKGAPRVPQTNVLGALPLSRTSSKLSLPLVLWLHPTRPRIPASQQSLWDFLNTTRLLELEPYSQEVGAGLADWVPRLEQNVAAVQNLTTAIDALTDTYSVLMEGLLDLGTASNKATELLVDFFAGSATAGDQLLVELQKFEDIIATVVLSLCWLAVGSGSRDQVAADSGYFAVVDEKLADLEDCCVSAKTFVCHWRTSR